MRKRPAQNQKNPSHENDLGFKLKAWQFPTFTWLTATLSSALSGFTAEFGMGSGGSRSLCSPGKLVDRLVSTLVCLLEICTLVLSLQAIVC